MGEGLGRESCEGGKNFKSAWSGALRGGPREAGSDGWTQQRPMATARPH